MKKFILPIIFLAVIGVVFGVYLWSTPSSEEIEQLNSTDIPDNLFPESFTSSVTGCAEKGDNSTTKSAGETQEPKIEVINNEVVYSRAINHACCRKANMDYEVNSSGLNIYEIWSGEPCKCLCFSELKAEKEVPQTPYPLNVNVYEKESDGSNLKLIISKTISFR